jgi:DNA-3-methyladenine glycosylase
MDWRELDDSAEIVAPRLLGCELIRELAGHILRVRIVETEAYRQDDAASHSYRGRTPRTDVMFGPSGHAYVYFTYGMHYCLNVVCGPVGYGTAVLIRAVEPITGQALMSDRRAGRSGAELTNGPAKLCQALGIDKSLTGHDLRTGELRLVLRPPVETEAIIQTTRVGITQARDMPWRFYLRGNPYVSRP